MRRMRSIVTPLALALVLATGSAWADKANDTLTWSSLAEPPNISYYANTQRDGLILAAHIWDGLVYRDERTGEFKPHVAKAIHHPSPALIEIELRDDVLFHNGDKLTAEDVAWTLNFFNSTEGRNIAPTRTSWIERAEVVAPDRVRLHLPRPFPAAMAFLASVMPIYPKAYYLRLGHAGFAKAPVGTGPYQVHEIIPGKHIVLKRFAGYFGGAKGKASIATLIYRPIVDRNAQIDEVLAGKVEWLWQFPVDQCERLKARKGIVVRGGETMRIAYLSFDAIGSASEHPLANRTVRQALAHAIDRQAIVRQYKPPGAEVVDLACYPGQFGCASPGAPVYDFEPEKARRLLAKAGFPNGFTVDFYGSRDRPVMEAIATYLKNVGVSTRLHWVTASELRQKRRLGQAPLALASWGSSGIPDGAAILGVFFNGSIDDRAQDARLSELVDGGETGTDMAQRRQAYAAALGIVATQIYWLPLYADAHYYAHVDQLDFTPSADEVPRFFNARWK